MSSLEVTNLSKSFGRLKALDDISLDVIDGEFMVLLGPTAAGKTTTLRCVAGLEKLDSGVVKMDGEIINGLAPAERDVAFVFQTYALYPRKTAFQNMAFPLLARKWSEAQITERIHEIAEKLQIMELLDRRPANMSGGQQQRVALGRAMVRNPRLFLMDEPLTNLDFKLRVEMRAELKRLQQELATTFFYVTNDQVEAMSVADRIAVLNEGVLQQIDTPETIYNHPANLFVAQFVGSPRMNTLDCHYDASNGRLVSANSAQWELALNDEQQRHLADVSDSQALLFGVRAEDIDLHFAPQANAIGGEIFILEPLGDRTFVDVELGGHTMKARALPDFAGQEGEQVWMHIDIERIHIFDKTTSATIF